MSPNGVVLASRQSRSLSKRLIAGLRAIAVLAIGIAFSATVSVAAAATTEADTDYILFHHHDALGSTVATNDEQGRVLWYENSNPYGESRGRHSAEGLALDPSASFGTTNERLDTERPPLGYAGHVRDGGSDLIYMQQRHYDPVLGRFLSNDPVGFRASNPMMFNRYAYANNNPYGFVDPDGREVRLQTHGVFGSPFNHSKIVIIPDDQRRWANDHRFKDNVLDGKVYATVGAGPKRNRLISGVNRPTDLVQSGNRQDEEVVDPSGRTENELINDIFEAEKNFPHSLDYDFAPSVFAGTNVGYNSNSFISGLLDFLGLTVTSPPVRAPAYNRPVPPENYQSGDESSTGRTGVENE